MERYTESYLPFLFHVFPWPSGLVFLPSAPGHFAPEADFDFKVLLLSDLPLSLNHWPTSKVQSPSVAKFPGLQKGHMDQEGFDLAQHSLWPSSHLGGGLYEGLGMGSTQARGCRATVHGESLGSFFSISGLGWKMGCSAHSHLHGHR